MTADETRRLVTETLVEVERDPGRTTDQLAEVLYPELKEIADRELKRGGAQLTLVATDLVHEAYVRLVDQRNLSGRGRTYFLAASCVSMRRILVDHARTRKRQKRGGGWQRVHLDDAFQLVEEPGIDILDLDEALERLKTSDARAGRVVELRLYGSMTVEQVADFLDMSERTVHREWRFGTAWLRKELAGEPHDE